MSLVIMASLFGAPKSEVNAAYSLKVSYVDVGQGNASLIQYRGKNVLVDTGDEKNYSKLKAYLKKLKIKTIDNMILTHYDSDHMGASDLLIEDYKVKKVSVSAYENENKDTYQVRELKSAIAKYKVKKVKVKAGQKVTIKKGVQMKVLGPVEKAPDSNENSIVLRLVHGKKSFLFTGDIDSKVESKIYKKYNVKSSVLLVAHHGSSYSSGMLFLKKVSPEYAVISVGKDNSYGHPTGIVLNRLKSFAKKILRTDLNGTVQFTSNGKKLTMKKVKGSVTDSSNSPQITPAPSAGKYIGNKNKNAASSLKPRSCKM